MRPIHFRIVSALFVAPSIAGAQPPAIVHEPVACAVAEKFPRLLARFDPPANVAVARLVFQGQTADWYSVAMKPEGSLFAGVLPQPRKDLKSFRYYIEVTDKALGVSRTTEFTTSIIPSSGACKGGLVSASIASASVVLQGPAGLATLPAGFASSGVVAGSAVGTSAGASGASGAAGGAAAGSGGLSGGALAGIVGGVGAAAVAGVAVAKKEGDEGSSSVNYRVTFDSNSNQTGIGLVECGGHPGTFFSEQNLEVDKAGNFNTIWGSPQLIRVVGQAGPTSLQATMTCLNGARSGTMTASGSPNGYNGTFEFGNSRGTVAITRRQ